MLKRWVSPMIKCSHLTPKSIYSYIDDLVIANCLIDARVIVHALPHISFAILLCEHVGCIIFSIWGHPFVALIVWLFLFCQMDGQECLRTPSSYLCFSCLKLYSCYITKFDQVRFEPLCVRSTPKLVCAFRSDRFIPFGPTEITKLI